MFVWASGTQYALRTQKQGLRSMSKTSSLYPSLYSIFSPFSAQFTFTFPPLSRVVKNLNPFGSVYFFTYMLYPVLHPSLPSVTSLTQTALRCSSRGSTPSCFSLLLSHQIIVCSPTYRSHNLSHLVAFCHAFPIITLGHILFFVLIQFMTLTFSCITRSGSVTPHPLAFAVNAALLVITTFRFPDILLCF